MNLSLITIDPDFRDYFPPLEPDAYEALKEKIIHEGFTDPVKLWSVGYNNYLLDGHHRYQICKELGIEPRHVFIKCADKKAALEWIRENQRARRNTTTYRIIEQYLADKQAIADQARLNQQKALSLSKKRNEINGGKVVQNFGQPIESKGKTDAQIAKMADSNPETVRQVRYIKKAGYTDIIEQVESGKMSIYAGYKESKKRDAEKLRQEGNKLIASANAVKPKKEEVPDWAKDIDVEAELEAAAPTLEQIVEDQQREISQLQALLESFQAKDSAKEIRKWEQIATNSRREADAKANRLTSFQRQLSQQRPIMQFLYTKHGNVTPTKLLSLLKDVYQKAEGL